MSSSKRGSPREGSPERGSDLVLEARAKVNLHLRALGRRPDGYTEILTVFQTVSLSDVLSFRLTSRGVRLDYRGPSIPPGENLAVKAARLFFRETGIPRGVSLRLHKRIPLAAGLGGGSSDAAAVLRGCNLLLGSPVGPKDLAAMGAGLGSDVPFFLLGGTALGQGRGDILKPLPDLPRMPLVIVQPAARVPAATAYGLLPAALTAEDPDIRIILRHLDRGDILGAAPLLANDLQAGVMRRYPSVRRAAEALGRTQPVLAMMSGSGSCCFGLYGRPDEAVAAAERLSGQDRWRVLLTTFSPRGQGA